jgi:hypothetical protein
MNLNKEFIDKNLESMNKNALSRFGDVDGKNDYLFEDGVHGTIEEIDDNRFGIIVDNPELGFFTVDIDLDDNDLVRLLEMAVKKMNKFKNLLESLK